jgi:nondiscriminating glutamyl-tRNA synthetase
MTLDDLIERFDLRRMSANPSIFDEQRLLRFNKRKLQHADTQAIADLVRPRLVATYGRWEASEGTAQAPEEWLALLVGAAQEEAGTLTEIVTLSVFCLADSRPALGDDAQEALRAPEAEPVLAHALETLEAEVLATPEIANAHMTALRHHWRDEAGLRGRQVMFPIRAALIGSTAGPCLGIITTLLGPERCKERIREALAWIASH